MYPSPRTRSILKAPGSNSSSKCSTPEPFPAALPYSSSSVHFPPSPKLSRTFPALSRAEYDRSPVTVVPNACAMPARGCPGRTYHSSSTRSYAPASGRNHYACEEGESIPRLTRADTSSSEEDSDGGLVSPPPELALPLPTPSSRSRPTPIPISRSDPSTNPAALAYLPHDSSPPTKPRARKPPSPRRASFTPSFGGFGNPAEDGCLGGF